MLPQTNKLKYSTITLILFLSIGLFFYVFLFDKPQVTIADELAKESALNDLNSIPVETLKLINLTKTRDLL